MIVLRLREQMLVIGCVLLLSVIKTIETASDPIEELGDFTLYSHGEIGRYSGYKGTIYCKSMSSPLGRHNSSKAAKTRTQELSSATKLVTVAQTV